MSDPTEIKGLFQQIQANNVAPVEGISKLMNDFFGLQMSQETFDKIINVLSLNPEGITFKQFEHLIYVFLKYQQDDRLALFYALDVEHKEQIDQPQFRLIMLCLNISITDTAIKQLFLQFSKMKTLNTRQYLELFTFCFNLRQQ